MFNKEQLITYLNELKLAKTDYCIIAGGSFVMHGVKEQTEDVDLYVSENGLKQLQKIYNVEKSKKGYPNLYTINKDLEVVLTDLNKQSIYWIEGIPCSSALAEYKTKKLQNREKDKAILQQFENILKEISEYYKCSENWLTEEKIENYLVKVKSYKK